MTFSDLAPESWYFTEAECSCRCGCGLARTERGFARRLNVARFLAACPFVINSWCRCESHNAAVGGKPGSAHLRGLAVDIATPNSVRRGAVLTALYAAGFTRVGVYDTHIHVDESPGAVREVTWVTLED